MAAFVWLGVARPAAADDLLVVVINASGQPVANVGLSAILNGVKQPQGATGSDGTLQFDMSVLGSVLNVGKNTPVRVVTAECGEVVDLQLVPPGETEQCDDETTPERECQCTEGIVLLWDNAGTLRVQLLPGGGATMSFQAAALTSTWNVGRVWVGGSGLLTNIDAKRACEGFPPAPFTGGSCGTDNTTYRGDVLGGLRIWGPVAVEGGWANLGKVTLSADASTPPLGLRSSGFFDPNAAFARVVVLVPLGGLATLAGNVGAAWWNSDSGNDTTVTFFDDSMDFSARQEDDGVDPTAGVALLIHAGPFSIAPGYQWYRLKSGTGDNAVDERVNQFVITIRLHGGR